MNAGVELVVRWVLALALLVAGAVTWRFAGFFGQSLLAEIAIFALLAMSVDLLAGGVGLMSLGQAMYFGLGAYTTAMLTTRYGVAALATMPVAMALAALVALAVGAAIVRFGEIIFIMLTLALGEMFTSFVFANRGFGGSDGIPGVPRADLSWIGIDLLRPASFAATVLVIVLVAFVGFDALSRSPLGLVFTAVKRNPARALALGANLTAVRTAAYVIASAIAALAGTLMAQLNGYVSPDLAGWDLSGLVLIMVIFGGLGSVSGAALGAVVIKLLSHYVAKFTSHWGLVLGIIFIIVVLFAENGLFALLCRAAGRRNAAAMGSRLAGL
jgi:branched-chain amino acid transport system permease protein